jgi:predicted AAA+ superfamily ATPase
VQVCADLARVDTRQREVRALEAAMGEVGLREGTIVTMHDAEDLSVEGGVIHVVPAWAWMLGIE